MKLKLAAMLGEIMKHIFRRPATIECPFENVPHEKGIRGKPVMDPEKCIGCQRCVKDCPAEAIEINKVGEVTNDKGKVVKRFAMTLYLDRCCHCAQCAESCPTGAIVMDEDYCHATLTREEMKYVYAPDLSAKPAAPAAAPAVDKPA